MSVLAHLPMWPTYAGFAVSFLLLACAAWIGLRP